MLGKQLINTSICAQNNGSGGSVAAAHNVYRLTVHLCGYVCWTRNVPAHMYVQYLLVPSSVALACLNIAHGKKYTISACSKVGTFNWKLLQDLAGA